MKTCFERSCDIYPFFMTKDSVWNSQSFFHTAYCISMIVTSPIEDQYLIDKRVLCMKLSRAHPWPLFSIFNYYPHDFYSIVILFLLHLLFISSFLFIFIPSNGIYYSKINDSIIDFAIQVDFFLISQSIEHVRNRIPF